MAVMCRILEGADELRAWDRFVASHPQGSHWHLSWWLDCHRAPFSRTGILAVEQDGRIVAGTAWHRYGFRQCNVTIVSNGPLVSDPASPALGSLLASLKEDCRRAGSFLLQFEAFEPAMGEPLRSFFARHRLEDQPVWKLRHPGIWRDIRIPLAGRTQEELPKSFNRLARRQIRDAQQAGVEIVEGCDDGDIATAYEIFRESSARKGYVIRSRQDFRELIRQAWKHGMGRLLLARVEGVPAGFLFGVFHHCGAVGVHTGHTERYANIPTGRLLHWYMMLQAMNEGIPYLSLAAPGRGGVREFKDAFHPQLIDNTRFVTVILKPHLVEPLRGLIGDVRWMEPLKRLAARR